MDKSIIQLVDELPTDNITVKVLNALNFVAPGEWKNLVGFDNAIRTITGETDAKVVQRIRDRAASLYIDPQKSYQSVLKLYQTIDKADTAMATAALANKLGEKIAFLSFLGNITPKADLTQTIDLVLKIAVEIIAYCKLNGIPQPNPQAFANALANNYQDASLMRMISLVCLDGILPLGSDFLGKIQAIINSTDTGVLTQNPTFLAVNNSLPGNNPNDKLSFITQSFNSVQGWMNNLVTKTGITPQSISNSLGGFIQVADDNLDFVAAFVDQTTNYYEHTGTQTVARSLILQAYALVSADIKEEAQKRVQSFSNSAVQEISSTTNSNSNQFTIGQSVEVWDEDEEDWYAATITEIEDQQYFVHYVDYDSSYDEWIDEDDVRSNSNSSDETGYLVGQKVKVWDDDEEDWYSATIKKIKEEQYLVHYSGYDSSFNEWVDEDEIV